MHTALMVRMIDLIGAKSGLWTTLTKVCAGITRIVKSGVQKENALRVHPIQNYSKVTAA